MHENVEKTPNVAQSVMPFQSNQGKDKKEKWKLAKKVADFDIVASQIGVLLDNDFYESFGFVLELRKL